MQLLDSAENTSSSWGFTTLGTAWHALMMFLEPRTRDVHSIREHRGRAGREPHKCRTCSPHCSALITTQHALAVGGWHVTAWRILPEEHLNCQGLGFPQKGATAASLASRAQPQQRRRVADGSRAGQQPAGWVTQSCSGSKSRPSDHGNVAQVRAAELSRFTTSQQSL